MAYEKTQPAFVNGATVLLGTHVEISTTSPLAEFSTIGSTAFAARTKGVNESDLVALLCNRGLPDRSDLINPLRAIKHPSFLSIVEAQPIYWPKDDASYFCTVYERPQAPRLLSSLDEVHPPLGEEVLNVGFVNPMIGALAELKRSGLVHNMINPTNIFWRRGSSAPFQLGDCVTAPAGCGQSIIFEPIERAQCNPMGRGVGVFADDCYAFGMALAFLLIGQNPFHGMDDATIIQMKNERGTFSTIMGNRRLHTSYIELLRGLLNDHTNQRWTVTDLEQWQQGRRAIPKKSDAERRAPRHFDFGGHEFWQTRPLAAAFYRNIPEAVTVIENGTLDKWLRRSMLDEERALTIIKFQDGLKKNNKSANYPDLLVARVCMALDVSGPIRYRGLSLMPAGFDAMVVDAAVNGRNLQVLSEMIAHHFVQDWVDLQKEDKAEKLPLSQQFERLRSILENPAFGHGFERIVYELNPNAPCLSPLIRNQYVLSPRLVLSALERVPNMANRSREPMDRHIAAFLIVRDKFSEKMFLGLSAPDGSIRRGLCLLSIFVEMQSRSGNDALTNIAQWLLPSLESMTRRYLGKVTREKTQAEVKQAAERGNLALLQRLLDDAHRLERDQQEFMAARMLYFNIMKEINNLEVQLADRENAARTIGYPAAATLSSLLAIMLAVIILVRAVWQHMF